MARISGIYQRKDGRYARDVWFHGKRKTIYGKTRKDVADKVRKAEQEYAAGKDIATKRQTLETLLNRWLDEIVIPHRKHGTARNYQQIVRDHLIPTLGSYWLDELTPQPIQTLVNTLAQQRKPRTVRNVRACLRRALQQAMAWRLVTHNAAVPVTLPRITKYHITPLSDTQARALLRVLAGHRREILYRMALLLGLREGELLALQWQDIDIPHKVLRITGSLQRIDGTLQRNEPKTRTSQRTLPIPDSIMPWLLTQQQDEGLVFVSNAGTPINPRNLARQFKVLLKKAGLPATIRFHDLRHSCATFLIMQGEHPRTVMEVLGHSQISITMDTYGHVFDATQRSAVGKLDGFFQQPLSEPPSNDTIKP